MLTVFFIQLTLTTLAFVFETIRLIYLSFNSQYEKEIEQTAKPRMLVKIDKKIYTGHNNQHICFHLFGYWIHGFSASTSIFLINTSTTNAGFFGRE